MNKTHKNPKIEILPEHIIDQIKAGEVLERPASLIKELIENSLDAGASEIIIHIVDNGLDLLSIEDNGHGMSFENLPYAFLRHATSKLKTYEDLYRLHSFGFRGEALASVAASARLTCITQPTDLNAQGGKIIIHGGAEELLIPYQSNGHGTSIFIKDLFYNTPARLKFIKSKVSEKSALKKMLYAFVLSNPQTIFSIKWDDKEREIFKSVNSVDNKKRIEQVFFSKQIKGTEQEVWSFSESYQDYKVEIYFSPGTFTSPQYRHHYLFANNRLFQDKSLHLCVLRTLEPLWRFGESGHYVVKITVPADEIDVNVHPNKTQIKFFKADVIYSLLVTSLRGALKANSKLANPSSSGSEPIKQEQFFSREENQSFDLINMNSSDHSNEYRSTRYGLQSVENFISPQQSSPILGFITSDFFLISHQDKFYIGALKKVMASFLSVSLDNFILNEEVSTPLLISEPLKVPHGKVDSHLEAIKDLGFELDRLNSEVLALRTIPSFVPQNISRDIIFSLIYYFNQPKISKYETLSFKIFIEANWSTSNPMPVHILSNIVSAQLKNLQRDNSPFVLLDENNLKRLF